MRLDLASSDVYSLLLLCKEGWVKAFMHLSVVNFGVALEMLLGKERRQATQCGVW